MNIIAAKVLWDRLLVILQLLSGIAFVFIVRSNVFANTPDCQKAPVANVIGNLQV
jgi:hypothetical protein